MNRRVRSNFALLLFACTLFAPRLFADGESQPGRDPKQPVDEAYTAKMKKYTTEPFFTSPLVDYLPASKTVPTPEAVLGDVAGAPGILPYAKDVYAYMRLLEKSSPRVKVFSIGTTEEGREMIAVAVSSESNLKKMEENRALLGKLADPRTLQMNDAEADKIVAQAVPIYYITGTIHSPETGAPTALMELAYRLAVDESAYIKDIRDGMITLITPVVEVDGRDRMVDIYKWHLAHPGQNYPNLVYWGKYVAHDNNRDAMGMTLKLTQNVMETYAHWHPQVLHDLHESVPYLYDNTIGDGPYNAWIDPILADEWQMIGSRNVADMTKFGMPGVFAHGDFDTWSPGYLMFIAALHNGISRLYETFGNGGADTLERTLDPEEYARTWFKQNPPLPKAMWSQRDNNNYEETGLLVSLHYFNENKRLFLKNFYTKSRRAIEKPKSEGPAAYVLPADETRPTLQLELLKVLQKQHVEISRATAAFTVALPPKKEKKKSAEKKKEEAKEEAKKDEKPEPTSKTFPAGSYVIRMDQPYSRIADALLDHQYWSPDDPQKTPYDDTGWTFGELYGVQVARITDAKILQSPMQSVKELTVPGGLKGEGTIFALENHAEPGLASLRYKLKDADMQAAEEPFESAGKKFPAGTILVKGADRGQLDSATKDLGLQLTALAAAPSVKAHPLRAARILLLHTWLSTQTEGWWRLTLDKLGIPFDYASTQTIAGASNLREKYDVILFPPVGWGGSLNNIVNGLPTSWGNPLPWENTPLTPNLVGKNDSTPDMRPGLGWQGVANLQKFVSDGGVLLTVMDTAQFAAQAGLTSSVNSSGSDKIKIVGAVVGTRLVDAASPIAYGYNEKVAAYCDNGPVFSVTSIAGSRRRRHLGPDMGERPTGRGTKSDPDFSVGRVAVEPTEEPESEVWETPPVTDEQRHNNPRVIPPAQRARVVLRYADSKDLLISGLVEGGGEIAQHPAVVDSPLGKGHVVMFSINPVWRGETQGTYSLVLNTVMNFDNLDAGRKDPDK
ncbi:MAG TPA: M14 family zinc carboxypeptidase [Candidatus Acidoferrum sp.]|nr:M14 family zinc carboxypeptidase [Candidatus Acidoferrum sp.]